MRNRFPGGCYRCGERVEAGAGYFERRGRWWFVQHVECCHRWRGVRPAATQEEARAERHRLLQTRTPRSNP